MPTKEDALALLRTAVGSANAEFRPGQWEAISGLLQRQKLLVVQRTGWGKSIIYFLAAKLLRQRGSGFVLLISPLLSLMRNQIDAARRIQVRAETINSTNDEDWTRIQESLERGEVDLLLVSPERLGNEHFVSRVLLPAASRIGLMVVDEAHCISDWGHDFRPDYRRITRILRALPPNIPVLATTATANDRVVEDIESQLGPNLQTIRGPLARESLILQNLHLPSKSERLAWLASHFPQLPGSGVIYTLTIRDAENVASWLRSCALNVAAYHSELESEERERLESSLLHNEVKALVATVALGMGFDKPDLGFVVHFQRPSSVVAYYQQVGRAGRAIALAHGVLLSGAEDDDIADYFIGNAFPSKKQVEQFLAVLREGPMTIGNLQDRLNIRMGKLAEIIRFLTLESPAPIRKLDKSYVRNPVQWRMPVERITRLTQLRRNEQQRMQEYLSTTTCLMQFLARELSDPDAAPCGRCVNCGGDGLGSEFSTELERLALGFLNRLDLPIEPRKMWPGGLMFEGVKGKIASESRNQSGRALCRWGDPGFGELIREGKQRTNAFADSLVRGAAELITQRWNPQPRPQWLTCVPSRRKPALVSNFAQELANRLGIPFVRCLRKIRDTEPQKTRENTFQQVRNLESAFEIDSALVRPSPVLLVDDMVDSKWTFTVLGFKLLQAGSGPVFPFALADSSIRDGD